MALHDTLAVLHSALAALLSEPAPGNTVTPGLAQQYKAASAAVQSCYDSSWTHQAVKRMMQKQVFLKLWQQCRQLAAARHYWKTMCAVEAAYFILQGMQNAGIVHDDDDHDDSPAAAQTSTNTSVAASSAAVAQQLQQSGFLDQLPVLLTDAARQLQAVVGVWPVNTAAADKARWAYALSTDLQPGLSAQARAINTQRLLILAARLVPGTLEGSSESVACCMQAAEHCVLATWQYLSAVLQDSSVSESSGTPSTMQRFAAPTSFQQELTRSATDLGLLCTYVAPRTSEEAHASTTAGSSTGLAPPDRPRVPEAGSAQPAVVNRHRLEGEALCMVLMQLTLQMRTYQQQQARSIGPGPSAQQRPSEAPEDLAAGRVPAALHRMLQQLGINSSVVVWALTQSSAEHRLRMSSADIKTHHGTLARGLMIMCTYNKDFLLTNSTGTLPQLQELQQQLQLLTLFPAVLLQWAVDCGTELSSSDSMSQYSYNCVTACWASRSLIRAYNDVLRNGPPSLYQHMTGQERPQDPPGANTARGPKIRVPLPADAYAGQLQVLDELLPTLLRLWEQDVGLEVAGSKDTAAGSDQDAASSTEILGDRGSSSVDRRAACGSSSSGSRSRMYEPEYAAMAAGDLLLEMVEQFPGALMDPDVREAGSSAAATAAAAGQLCALLEHMCRAEMTVTRHFSALKAAGVLASSSSGASQDYRPEPDHLRNVSNNLITFNLVGVYLDDSTLKVSPLVDPIITLSSPGSQPSQQLCSLLATLLKVARHVSSQKPTKVLQFTEYDFRQLFLRNHFKPFNVLLREVARVIQITCAAVECAAPQQMASKAAASGSSSCSSGAGDGSSSAAASPSDVPGSMALLVLLGRCCLQLGELTTSVSPEGCKIAAALKFYLDAVVTASSGWLSAGSNAAQLAALGYDSEGVTSCLRTAAAASDRVSRVASATGLPACDKHASTAALQAAVATLQEQLRAVGGALTSFTHPSACNNPACLCFSGPSEVSLVQGNTGSCSSCKAARYCCKACQKAAWRQHKPVCKALTAAAAAAAEGEPEVST